jgi:hypothetical protein
MLSFYLLPAFAATLKIRAKKLAQVSGGLGTTDVVSSPFSGSLFFENLTSKLSSISFQRESSDTTSPFNHLVLKNEAFYKFNLSLLSEFKIVTLFISSKKKNKA